MIKEAQLKITYGDHLRAKFRIDTPAVWPQTVFITIMLLGLSLQVPWSVSTLLTLSSSKLQDLEKCPMLTQKGSHVCSRNALQTSCRSSGSRIHLPAAELDTRSPGKTYMPAATKPISRNYWSSHVTEPMPVTKRGHHDEKSHTTTRVIAPALCN